MFGSSSCGSRSVDAPRTYRVRLVLFGSKPVGDHRTNSITAHIQGTSSMQARMSAQASYPGYTVVDVMEA
jgi:hypothetical protein